LTFNNLMLREIGSFQVTTLVSDPPWKENCYLIRHLVTGEQVLIDPGDDADAIIQEVLSGGSNLRYIWLTHAHHDHLGAVAALGRQFGIVCDLHKNDVRLLHHAPMYALRFAQKNIELPEAFRTFGADYSFQFGDQAITIIHVPGHTQGSVCYVIGDFVFTGDTLMYKHVGRTDLPGGDASLLKSSVNKLLEVLPGDKVIFPGHGRAWTVADAQDWWQTVTNDPPEHNTFEMA